ncbi:hypothetical protein M406DRAFT_259453, partial [Cryphonectria parasitica EP155]
SLQKSSLLSAIAIFSSLLLILCLYCKDYNLLAECKIAKSESFRYQICIHLSLSNCNVCSLISAQLNHIIAQYYCLKAKIKTIEKEAAKLNAKLLKLYKQKRM